MGNPHYRSLNTHRSNTHTFQTGWCSLGSSSPLLCKRPEAPFLVGREDEEGWWFLPSKGKERRERRRRIRRRRDVLRGGVPSVTSGPERSVERPERGAIRVQEDGAGVSPGRREKQQQHGEEEQQQQQQNVD